MTSSPIRIAVNTMRARLTILGFNLAIIAFQITHLSTEKTGAVVAGFDGPLHVPAMVALYFALLLSIAAMVLLISSGGITEDGTCDTPAMIAGDLLMYLGLAYTVVGFFEPLFLDLNLRRLPTADETESFRILLFALSMSTAVVWFMAAYVGPIVSLIRSPFSRTSTIVIGALYLILMVGMAYFLGVALELQTTLEGRAVADWPLLRLLFMPIDWFAPINIEIPSRNG